MLRSLNLRLVSSSTIKHQRASLRLRFHLQHCRKTEKCILSWQQTSSFVFFECHVPRSLVLKTWQVAETIKDRSMFIGEPQWGDYWRATNYHSTELARLSRGSLWLSRFWLQTPGRKKMQLSFRAHRLILHKHCSCAQKSLCHSKPYRRSFANCLWALVLVAAVSMPTIHTHSGFHLPLHIHWALPGHSILYLKWQTDFILIL